jgi:hypothetical protein
MAARSPSVAGGRGPSRSTRRSETSSWIRGPRSTRDRSTGGT